MDTRHARFGRSRIGGIINAIAIGIRTARVGFAISAERERQNTQRALEERDAAFEAEGQRTRELQQVVDFQSGQLGAIDPPVMGLGLRQALIDAVPDERREMLEDNISGINFTNVSLKMLEENIFERTIDAIDAQFDDQPTVRAQLLQTVAGTMTELGLYDLAEGPQVQALEIHKRVVGKDHPQTIDSMNRLGALLLSQGRFDEAESYLTESIAGFRRLVGDDHPHTLEVTSNLGRLREEQGRLKQAEEYYRAALQGFRRVLGEGHERILEVLRRLGTVLARQDKLAQAEAFHRRALDNARRNFGNDDRRTWRTMVNLAYGLWRQGLYAEAESFCRDALTGFRRILGDDHPEVGRTLTLLGLILVDQGRLAEAEQVYDEALTVVRGVLGDEHADTTTLDGLFVGRRSIRTHA